MIAVWEEEEDPGFNCNRTRDSYTAPYLYYSHHVRGIITHPYICMLCGTGTAFVCYNDSALLTYWWPLVCLSTLHAVFQFAQLGHDFDGVALARCVSASPRQLLPWPCTQPCSGDWRKGD